MSLSENRQFYLTASVAKNAMADFETELYGLTAKLPDHADAVHILNFITDNDLKKAPLIKQLKSEGIEADAAISKAVYKYHKSQIKPFTTGMLTAAEKIAASYFIAYEDRDKSYKSASMNRGNDQELESIRVLEKRANIRLVATGEDQQFFTKGDLGVTPDGVSFSDGFEISEAVDVKNPDWHTHMKYLNRIKTGEDLLKVEPLYYWQAQTGIEVLELKRYLWMSYHRGYSKVDKKFKSAFIEIQRNDEHITILKSRARRVIEKSKAIIEELTS